MLLPVVMEVSIVTDPSASTHHVVGLAVLALLVAGPVALAAQKTVCGVATAHGAHAMRHAALASGKQQAGTP